MSRWNTFLPLWRNTREFGCFGRNGAGSGSPSMLEDLRRGHEGLMVKLNDVTRALKVCAFLEVNVDGCVHLKVPIVTGIRLFG